MEKRVLLTGESGLEVSVLGLVRMHGNESWFWTSGLRLKYFKKGE